MIIAWGGARRALGVCLPGPARFAALAALLIVLGTGCQACSSMAASLDDGAASLGANRRALGRASSDACTSDVMCPCGTFCHPYEHQCQPACMAAPAIGVEGCVTRNDARCLGMTGHH